MHINRTRLYRTELFRRLYLHDVSLNLIFAIANRGRETRCKFMNNQWLSSLAGSFETLLYQA